MIITVDTDLSITEDLVRLQRRVELYLFDLILLGYVADPVIYAARMQQVRHGYARIWNSISRKLVRRHVSQEGQTDAATTRGRIHVRSDDAGPSINLLSSRITSNVFSASDEARRFAASHDT